MLDKNITKYCYNNMEKYKADYKQSMKDGQIFFEISLIAGTAKELEDISIEAITTCIKVCNRFNDQVVKKEKKSPTPSKKEKVEVRM